MTLRGQSRAWLSPDDQLVLALLDGNGEVTRRDVVAALCESGRNKNAASVWLVRRVSGTQVSRT